MTALLDDQFPESVPARIETILIPPDVTPDGVVTEIIDYSCRRLCKFKSKNCRFQLENRTKKS